MDEVQDPVRQMLTAEAHAALQALAELGLLKMGHLSLARRLDAAGTIWVRAHRGTTWSTGMDDGIGQLIVALRDALALAQAATWPHTELAARVTEVLADKAHPERPELLAAFSHALRVGLIELRRRPAPAPPGEVVPGYRCTVCQGPVYRTLAGTMCAQRHAGTENLELDPLADRAPLTHT